MKNNNNMTNIVRQAQRMQGQIQKVQGDIGEKRVERLAFGRRLVRQQGTDLTRGHTGSDRIRLDAFLIARDPIDDLATAEPEFAWRHVAIAVI